VDHHQVGQFWEGNAEVWARLSRLGYNVSRDEITMPAFLALLPEVAGLSGLDIGCGEGHGSRLLARRKARMSPTSAAITSATSRAGWTSGCSRPPRPKSGEGCRRSGPRGFSGR
jgi:hypothetical protein